MGTFQDNYQLSSCFTKCATNRKNPRFFGGTSPLLPYAHAPRKYQKRISMSHSSLLPVDRGERDFPFTFAIIRHYFPYRLYTNLYFLSTPFYFAQNRFPYSRIRSISDQIPPPRTNPSRNAITAFFEIPLPSFEHLFPPPL